MSTQPFRSSELDLLRAPGLLVEARYRGRTLCARVLSPASRRGFTVGAGRRADAPMDVRYLPSHVPANDNHTLISPAAGGFVVDLSPAMRERARRTDAGLRVECGEVVFDISAMAPPPAVPRPWLPRDWSRAARLPAAVAFATLLFLLLIDAVPSDPHALSLDDVGRSSRWANARVIPLAPVPAPAPVREASPSAGAGPAGSGGHDGAPKARVVQTRHAHQGGDPRDVVAFVHGSSVLSVLDGLRGDVADVFASAPALGDQAANVLAQLEGTEVAGAFSVGGIVGRGTGAHGADTGLGLAGGPPGLGTVGPRHGVGGRGFDDARVGRLAARDAHPLVISTSPPITRGGLDREIVRRVVRQHLNEVRYCYEQALTRSPALSGRVVAHFTIAPNGAVLVSALQSSTLGDARAESCIVGATRRWSFPQPQGGGLVTVSYPFQLSPAGG